MSILRFAVVGFALVLSLGCQSKSAKTGESELQVALKQDRSVILDVRSAQEFAAGHVPGAINLPVDRVNSSVQHFIENKDTPIIVHCAKGGRSARAAKTMTDLGYSKVHDAKTAEAVLEAKGVSLTTQP